MDKYCIIANSNKDENFELTQIIKDYLEEHNKICIIPKRCEDVNKKDFGYADIDSIPDEVECAIVLGGDGTIIQAASKLATKDIPIFGVNLGTLGFLAEIEKHDIIKSLDCLMEDNLWIERRMMLSGVVEHEGKKSFKGRALNDVVITRSGFSRIIKVMIYINGELVDTYRGDGVIISTPTGSTAYNLSAGGPIATPSSNTMIITPVCPHTLISRSIIVSATDKIVVEIGLSKKTQKEEAIATFDGNIGLDLETGDRIEICKTKEETKLIKINNISFFEILRNKIGSDKGE